MTRAAHQIVRRPLLTEKGTRLRESGGHAPGTEITEEELRPKVFFEVAPDANKIEIKHAVEALFNVKVHDVHTQVVRGKEKRMGRFTGMRPHWKKAIVTLAKGNKIDFFEGV
jgi:large subunit ribosomal protein L23